MSKCKVYITFVKTISHMSSKLLLPNKYKLIGWCLLIPATIWGTFLSLGLGLYDFGIKESFFGNSQFFSFVETYTNTIVGTCFIAGGMLVGFSKEKREDEFIEKLRWSSMLWAVWVNYVLLLLAILFVYDMDFFRVMVYNMFTVLIIFIVRFNYILYKNSKTVSDEK
jgi:hypothetical protein